MAKPKIERKKRPKASELDRLTDQLNQKIEEFESHLQKSGKGVSAAVCMDTHYTDFGEPSSHMLAFDKVAGEFRLISRLIEDDESEDTKLLNAARETRLQAVEHFPALVEALKEAYDKEKERLRVSITQIDNLMNALAWSEVDDD